MWHEYYREAKTNGIESKIIVWIINLQFSEKHNIHIHICTIQVTNNTQWNASAGASPHTSQRAVGRKGSLTQKVEPPCSALLTSVSSQASSFASMRVLGAFALVHSSRYSNETKIHKSKRIAWLDDALQRTMPSVDQLDQAVGVCAFQSIERSSNGLQEEISSKRHPLPSIFKKTRIKPILQTKVTKT